MVTDHEGHTFNTIDDMCTYHNISKTTYRSRRSEGKSIKDALTKPLKPNNAITITDCFGNTFDSVSEMCRFHNINRSTYIQKITKGFTMEEILNPDKTKSIHLTPQNAKEIIDSKGNKFESIAKACRYYNITEKQYRYHTAKSNMPIDKISKIINDTKNKKESKKAYVKKRQPVKDPFGKEFKDVTDMCDYYNISRHIYYGKLKYGHSELEALNIIPAITSHTKNLKLYDKLTIISVVKNKTTYGNILNSYYYCMYEDHNVILSRNAIIKLTYDYMKHQS